VADRGQSGAAHPLWLNACWIQNAKRVYAGLLWIVLNGGRGRMARL